jgi:hypothetical protein
MTPRVRAQTKRRAHSIVMQHSKAEIDIPTTKKYDRWLLSRYGLAGGISDDPTTTRRI